MKRALFLMILSCIAVSTVTGQKPAKVAPKHYKVAEVPWPSSISSDGRYLCYVEDVAGADHVFVKDLKTGENRRLTKAPGEAGNSSTFSPESKQVAYDWVNEVDSVELCIVGIDGSAPRVLYRNEGLQSIEAQDWSPDGKQILASFFRKDGTYQLVVVSVADGSARVLNTRTFRTLNWRSQGNKMSFSPDGRHIAHDVPQEGSSQRDIFVLPAGGGGEIPLFEHPANDRLLGWTPDGKRLLFASDRAGKWDLWAIRVADGKPRGFPEVVKPSIGPIVWSLGFSRDGSYYYGVWTWMNDVYVATLDLARGKLRGSQKVVSQVGFNTSVEWSPDGQYLAYAWVHHAWEPVDLGIRSVETGKERRLRVNKLSAVHMFQPHWSPDGHFLLAQGWDRDYAGPGTHSRGVYRIDSETGEVTSLVQTETCCIEWPVWFSERQVILTRWNTEGPRKDRSIVRRDLQTGQEKELYRATSPARISHLAASPDDQHVAFLWYDRGAGKAALKIVSASGAEARDLVEFSALADYWMPLFALAWTPDSRHIIYAPSTAGDKPKFELWRISVGGGEPQNLGLTMEALLPYGLSVHPDGRRIAFTAGTPPRGEVWVLKDFLPAQKVPKHKH